MPWGELNPTDPGHITAPCARMGPGVVWPHGKGKCRISACPARAWGFACAAGIRLRDPRLSEGRNPYESVVGPRLLPVHRSEQDARSPACIPLVRSAAADRP